METIDFLKLFITSNVVLLFALILILIYFTNTRLLRKRGYGDEFIKYKKKDYYKRITGILIAVPVLEIIAGTVTYLIFGELNNSNHLLITFLIFLVLVIPFPIIDSIKTAKRNKELMELTRSSVAIDFKYKTFHRVFNPFWEVLTSLFVMAYYILFVDLVSPLVIIHLAIVWIIYTLVKRAKNMNKPLIRESYMYTFIILFVNRLFVVFHLIYPIFTKLECCVNLFMLITGINLAILLIIKEGYYIFQFSYFKKELQ